MLKAYKFKQRNHHLYCHHHHYHRHHRHQMFDLISLVQDPLEGGLEDAGDDDRDG